MNKTLFHRFGRLLEARESRELQAFKGFTMKVLLAVLNKLVKHPNANFECIEIHSCIFARTQCWRVLSHGGIL